MLESIDNAKLHSRVGRWPLKIVIQKFNRLYNITEAITMWIDVFCCMNYKCSAYMRTICNLTVLVVITYDATKLIVISNTLRKYSYFMKQVYTSGCGCHRLHRSSQSSRQNIILFTMFRKLYCNNIDTILRQCCQYIWQNCISFCRSAFIIYVNRVSSR